VKKYMKNKDFIPEKFYEKIESGKIKRENKILLFFLIIDLLLIPTTVKDIMGAKDKKVQIEQENKVNKNEMILNNINVWIDNIINDDIQEAYITSNSGSEITINDLNIINELSENSSIKIKNVNLKNENQYKLGVSLNE
jgi:hypothetical protein